MCILLPVLNEIENIAQLWQRICAALGRRPFTVCFVDDGSSDGTVEFLERVQATDDRVHIIRRVKTIRGCQRGGALRAALLWGLSDQRAQIFVEMDGDLSHRPEELPDGLRLIEAGTCDVAIAAKYLPESRVINRPLGRRLVSLICNFAVRLVISRRIGDYSNGYRFYTRDAGERIARIKSRYGSPIYLTEMMAYWLVQRMRIAEFPSVYVGRNEGLSKVRINDLAKACIGILEVATRYHVLGFPLEAAPDDQALSTPSAVREQI